MTSNLVDLRSDTITKPTPEMREAMARADVGDDVYGEDPTVNRLQELAAVMLGKEAALFVPSGTMGNLTAILTHCGRGEEVILGDKAHSFTSEAAGASALGGVAFYPLETLEDGTLPLDRIEGAIRADDPHYPRTSLIALENTHNRCGGAAIPPGYVRQVGGLAVERDLRLHIDGARIFNAAVALGVGAAELAAPADSITFCLSKGLCAPVGSLLCGDREFISRAHRVRKQLGGGMRQAGILAAAGVVALSSMVERLADDHARAATLASGLSQVPGIRVEPVALRTNMVFIEIEQDAGMSERELAEGLERHLILVGISGRQRIRLVTHHDVADPGIERAIQVITDLMSRK